MGPSIKDVRTFLVIFDPLSPLVYSCLYLADPIPSPARADTQSEKYSLVNILPSRFIPYPFTFINFVILLLYYTLYIRIMLCFTL